MIEMKTKLNKGIYRSCGGGEVVVHATWTTGPLNLLRAVSAIDQHRDEMLRGYGNIGCGTSWIEIDGVAIDCSDETDLQMHDREQGISYNPKSRMEKARALLASLRTEDA